MRQTAVIAMTEEKARELYELLKRRGIQASYIDRDTSVLNAGLQLQHFIWRKDWNLIRFSACLKRKKIL